MSLRVLLADESDTIKKVFQLALQDLNAEVKSVHSGLDVMDVARTFKPDIVFADILLQKKNGYEICLQIKQSTDLKNIPVVLMWSSFMELDQAQYKRSLASDQLEKPFDADNLREIVKKHSTLMNDNPMSSFLSFPKSFTVEATPSTTVNPPIGTAVTTINNLAENEEQENTSEFNLGAILSELNQSDALGGKPNKKINTGPTKSLFDDLALDAAPSTNQESWKEKDLSQFKISDDKSDDLDKFEALNLSSAESATNPAIPVPELSFELDKNDESEITPPPINTSPTLGEFSFSKTVLPTYNDAISTVTDQAIKPAVKPTTPSASTSTSTIMGMNDSEIEAIVRAHTEEVIKNHIKDSLIHVVEKIVREELHRIMEEELRLQQDADIDG